MWQSKSAPASHQCFSIRIDKNPKKKTNDIGRKEDGKEGEIGNRCDDEENLTDIG